MLTSWLGGRSFPLPGYVRLGSTGTPQQEDNLGDHAAMWTYTYIHNNSWGIEHEKVDKKTSHDAAACRCPSLYVVGYSFFFFEWFSGFEISSWRRMASPHLIGAGTQLLLTCAFVAWTTRPAARYTASRSWGSTRTTGQRQAALVVVSVFRLVVFINTSPSPQTAPWPLHIWLGGSLLFRSHVLLLPRNQTYTAKKLQDSSYRMIRDDRPSPKTGCWARHGSILWFWLINVRYCEWESDYSWASLPFHRHLRAMIMSTIAPHCDPLKQCKP